MGSSGATPRGPRFISEVAVLPRLGLRFVDAQRPSVDFVTIQLGYGSGGVRLHHLDEAETAGAARFPIGDNLSRLHRADAGKQLFEPGTQGEHKIARGYTPVKTWSAHWLEHPEFFSAIGDYLDQEQQHIDRYIEAVDSHSPYRKG